MDRVHTFNENFDQWRESNSVRGKHFLCEGSVSGYA